MLIRPQFFLSAASGEVSIIAFASIVGVLVGIASASFTSSIFFDHRNDKETVRNNKK